MSVYTHAQSPFWRFDFQIKRVRFHGTVEDEEGRPLAKTAPRRRAEEREAVYKARAREQLKSGKAAKAHITLNEALARFWLEHGQYLPSCDQVWSYAENWRRIGATAPRGSLLAKTLDQITDGDIAWFMSVRRGEPVRNAKAKELEDGTLVAPKLVAPRTVNADIEFLRSVFNRAGETWHVEIGQPPNWDGHLIDLPPPPTRVLTADEDAELFEAVARIRPDFGDMLEFADISGWRKREVIMLEKRKIDRQAMTARVMVKGGREEVKALTVEMLAIIERNWMHHPVRVFTYVCRKSRSWTDKAGQRQIQRQGQRYPFTRNGWRRQFVAILEDAGIEAFRFHDFRHTFGTRVYRATRDKGVVQRLLGHSDPATSDRYIHAAGEFERSSIEEAAKLRVPHKSRKGDPSDGENSGGAAG